MVTVSVFNSSVKAQKNSFARRPLFSALDLKPERQGALKLNQIIQITGELLMHNQVTSSSIRLNLMFLFAIAALFLIHASTLPAMAQSGATGTLSGIVQDPNGAHIPGVSITVRNIGTDASRTVTTDTDGRWTLPGLSVG